MHTEVMNKLRTNFTFAVLAFAMAALGAAAQAQNTTDQDQSGAAPAATGPDNGAQTIENPPLSGLDQPSFEPGFGARSYLVPKLQINEAVDTNRTGQLTTVNGQSVPAIKGVTRGLGSLTLQKMWKRHPLDIDYSGGVAWYQGLDTFYQVHSLSAVQRYQWRTGQVAFRDDFSYLPTGNFGFNSFGGSGAISGGGLGGVTGGGLGGGFGGGGTGSFGTSNFGSTVNQPRVSNMSVVDITQAFSPRNSITVAGGYGINDFLTNQAGYVDSHQYMAQIGFNRKLTRQDQIAVMYSYQDFTLPKQGSGFFDANVIQVVYGHRINGKLDLQIGGGPEWVHRFFVSVIQIPNPLPPPVNLTFFTPVGNTFLSGSGRAILTYHYSSRTNMNLTYSRSANAGSGLLAGANTDAIRLGLSHQLTRRWSTTLDSGYSYSKRILSSSTAQAGNSSAYRYWYAGGALRYQLSRHVGTFANYQYDAIGFASGICSGSPASCAASYGRHVGLIGLDWTPNPIRLE
jgi:hypothetical protein